MNVFFKAAFTVQQFSYERKSTFLRLEIVFFHQVEQQFRTRFSSVVQEDPPGSEVRVGALLRILERRDRSSFH
jgi:hypothetical protein